MIELMKRKGPVSTPVQFRSISRKRSAKRQHALSFAWADVVYYWHRVHGISIAELALATTVFVGKAGES
jgi:hypothetical protein